MVSVKIKHGIPKHDCFMIMRPAAGRYIERCRLANNHAGEIMELEDPVTGDITITETLDMYRYTLQDLPESICYITYGLSASKVKSAILSRYPGTAPDTDIEVVVLLKLKKHE